MDNITTGNGGDIYGVMDRLEISQKDIIDFSASINPLGTQKNVLLEIKKGLKNLIHYPDMNATKLREKPGNTYNIDPRSIICGNGYTELIYLIPRTMGFQKVLIIQPTFFDYERSCRIAHLECIVTYHMLDRKNNFDTGLQELIDTSMRDKIEAVFIYNPNNPTGRLLRYNDLMEIAQEMCKQQIYFIVDESFIEFSPGQSIADAVESNPYLVVLKSLTKFYGLAGLRLGYVIFPIHIADMLENVRNPGLSILSPRQQV